MATEANLSEELGGIVTTVKTQDTSDLDVQALLEANKAENEVPGDEGDKPEVEDKKETKPGKEKAKTGEPKTDDDQDDDDDDDKPIDFKSLSPKEQKLVAKAFQQQRNRNKKETRELRERTSALEGEIAGIKKGTTAAEPTKPAVVAVEKPVRPKRREFPAGDAGDDAFDAATEKYQDSDYKYKRAVEAEEVKIKQQQAEDQKRISDFNEAADKFMETHDDYEDVMDSDVPLTPLMFGYMLDEGPALGYYWGQNPEEAEKLSKMPPKQQEKAIIRLVIKLEDEAKAKKAEVKDIKPASTKEKKPDPPKPVAARGSTAVARDSSKMSFKEREKEFARTHPGVLNYEP